MRKTVRRITAMALGLAAVPAAIVVGGPISSGGFWLTASAAQDQTPVRLPWLEPYHRGGIDFATGLYVRTDHDLIVRGGDVPLVLQRTYRTEDNVSRAFGIGATHNGEWYLRGDGERFQWAELILDDGARVRYDRTSWGSSFLNALFEHAGSPSVFYGSRIGWTGKEWALRWLNGSVGIFRACSATGTDRCAIVELRTPAGLKLEYLRDANQVLRTIRSREAEIVLQYDELLRIVRARGSHGQEVTYQYDGGGRLTRVMETSGVVRRYTYDARGAMLTIDEPRWRIENAYDDGGRCVHQVTRWPDGRMAVLDVEYKVEDGSIVEASKSWNNGPKTVYHFNDRHYMESKEIDPTGRAPVVIVYLRNERSNVATGVTIRCYDAQKRLLRTADGEYHGEDATDAMAARICWEWAGQADQPLENPEPHEPPGTTSEPPARGQLI